MNGLVGVGRCTRARAHARVCVIASVSVFAWACVIVCVMAHACDGVHVVAFLYYVMRMRVCACVRERAYVCVRMCVFVCVCVCGVGKRVGR